ncbi:MAG TPA: hypothetical protein PLV37_00420 [Bacillota bacterium]|nr:hypothetical protein [Bacillota bacterium]
MKESPSLILALDTSNYTTSIAIVEKSEKILFDLRETLKVKPGERGLRQSQALFQHIQNLPVLLEKSFEAINADRIAAVAVSDKPRPLTGSYMPVFTGGLSCGRMLSATLKIPVFRFSHQEGHLAASAYGTGLDPKEPFLAFHLSGGTTELLHVDSGKITKLGGTKDLSFGQVIDRAGVRAGLNFPAGKEMDKLAFGAAPFDNTIFKPVHFSGLDINLSGLETQAERWMNEESPDLATLSLLLFRAIAETIIRWLSKAMEATGCNKILFTGGVASGEYIKREIHKCFSSDICTVIFGQPFLSSDNAVGIGLLGVNQLWP